MDEVARVGAALVDIEVAAEGGETLAEKGEETGTTENLVEKAYIPEKKEIDVKPPQNGRVLEDCGQNPSQNGSGRMLATPAVRRLVREHGLDPASVLRSGGTGKAGRVLKEDVLRLLDQQGQWEGKEEEVVKKKELFAAAGEAGGGGATFIDRQFFGEQYTTATTTLDEKVFFPFIFIRLFQFNGFKYLYIQ